jgi:hypothetical protein
MPPLNDDERKEPYIADWYRELTRKKSRESQGKIEGKPEQIPVLVLLCQKQNNLIILFI